MMDKVQLTFVLGFLLLLGQQLKLATAFKYYDHGSESQGMRYFSDKMTRFQTENEMAEEAALDGPLQSSLPCITGGATGSTLTELSLKYLINTAFPVFDDVPVTDPKELYGTTDYGETLAKNYDPLHIFWSDDDESKHLSIAITHPQKIWLNFPPYVNSSHFLITTYKDITSKPTIEITGMFAVEDMDSAVEQLRCLAKLKHLGFNLVHWNIEDFKNNMDEDHCKDLLTEAENVAGFIEEVEVVQRLLDHVNEISENPNVGDWCLPPTTMLAKLQAMQYTS